MSKPLTATQIRCLSAGKFIVGGITGLYLKKSSKTSGFFYLRFSDSTGRHEISLGLYPDLSLADARAAAAVARADLARGKAFTCAHQQQREKRRTAQAAARKKVTFETVARDWIRYQVQHDRWSQNTTGERVTTRSLEMYVFPHIGRLSIEAITVKDVARCFVDIWRDKHPVATKTRCIVSKIFQWAIANGIRKNQANPADTQGGLAVLLEPLSNHLKKTSNHPACAVEEIPRLFQEMHEYPSLSARACEFAILTCARSKAVRFAKWNEIDFEKKIWLISLENDKRKELDRDRVVFLSDAAIDLLKKLPRGTTSDYIFPTSHGEPLSVNAPLMFLRGLHEKRKAKDSVGWIDPIKSKQDGKECVITLHGTARATFRTWAKDDLLGNNRRFDQDAVELCLLHVRDDGYNGAYDRAPLASERRKIMAAWAKYCTSALSIVA